MVSGVSRGLGLALVSSLLDQGYGVSGFSRQTSAGSSELEERYPGRSHLEECDVTCSEAVQAFTRRARDKLGPVYGLINNAAVVQEGILATLPEVDIDRMVGVNLTAPLRLARLCVRDMIRAGCGRVINISSIVGSRGYNGLTVYSATKAALDGFTRSLAREVGCRGVTVNSVAPGYMKSDLSAGLEEEQLSQIERRTPLGRLAEFSDVIPLVRFLLSSEAAFITSQTICVDGGITN